MGGLYLADRLKQDGLHAGRVNDIVWVYLNETEFPEEGSAIYHPRCKDPVTPALVDSLCEGYDPKYPMTVRDAGIKNGKRCLEIIDGAQRRINGDPAQERLRAAGKLKQSDGNYKVAVVMFDGDDLACLMERERCQSDNLKRPHCPSVLFASYKAMERLGASREQIASVAPPGVDVASVLRWEAIDAKVQAKLDAHPAPFGMLAALLDVPRDGQDAAYEEMAASGAVTARKAKKVARKVTGVVTRVGFTPGQRRKVAEGLAEAGMDAFAQLTLALEGDKEARGKLAAKVREVLEAAERKAEKPEKAPKAEKAKKEKAVKAPKAEKKGKGK